MRWPITTWVQARRPSSGGGPGSTGAIELAVAGTEAVETISFRLTAWPCLSGCILSMLLKSTMFPLLFKLIISKTLRA